MTRRVRAFIAFGISASTLVAATSMGAQGASALVSVEGMAFDSLARRPLVAAMIAVEGTGRSAVSDGKGRFRIDSVPEGARVFMMQHAAFDSLGLSGTAVRVLVQQRTPRVVLAVPSFETLWRAACGDGKAPKDSGLVFGTVRDAKSLDAAVGVMVDGAWVDLVGGGKSLASVGQRRWRRTAATDARGEYALCGIPARTALTLSAALDTARVTSIELSATEQRVQRRDLLVTQVVVATRLADAVQDTAAALRRERATVPVGPVGTVMGIVTNGSGVPIPNAAVAVDTLAEIRTSDDGRFQVRNVPIGTRQLSIVAIGMTPYTATFDLREGDTTKLTIPMSSVQTLSEVSVKANTVAGVRERMINEHMALGLGDFRDSTFLETLPNMGSALRSIAGVTVSRSLFNPVITSPACLAFQVYLDGRPSSVSEFATIDVRAVAMLEMYKRKGAPSDVPGGRGCVILLWTKLGLRK